MIRHLLIFLLAATVPTSGARADQTGVGAQPQAAPFAEEIRLFGVEDQVNPPVGCETLFVGSSSIRFWFTLHRDFRDRPILKRGFGGARISDINYYFDQVVGRYRPAQIVFYAGENDLSDGRTVEQVFAEFERFLALKRHSLGRVPVHFVSIKPSIARAAERAMQEELNRRIEAIAGIRGGDLSYIDVASPMMRDGSVRPDLFISDGLHMNGLGYQIWRARIDGALQRTRTACVGQ